MVCAFGMTEATHQVATTAVEGAGHSENPGATPGLVGRSTGPQIRIVGPDGQSLPAETVGEVWLHGPTVVCGATSATRRSPTPTSPRGGCTPAIWAPCRRPATS
ncbi:AMP-binding enzyme family protein [Mycobacterium intracellulare 1956]|uniref:AMP-binding enzyme family protein n=1 Tax=Mycobacterium intracellulare 1956 TaxID=1299331 RepID=X8CEN3_MYCIT|nr:AMP-binding enzyme family protein [Mycobacterium intracellulare 1956]